MGIHHRVVMPHAPWQNGRAERAIQAVKRMLRATIATSAPEDWPNLLAYVVSAINHTRSRTTGMAPFEVFYGEEGKALLSDTELPYA